MSYLKISLQKMASVCCKHFMLLCHSIVSIFKILSLVACSYVPTTDSSSQVRILCESEFFLSPWNTTHYKELSIYRVSDLKSSGIACFVLYRHQLCCYKKRSLMYKVFIRFTDNRAIILRLSQSYCVRVLIFPVPKLALISPFPVYDF